MVLQSMTGFARREGTSGRSRWAWELRSVNGKGLDVRLRLPPGLERLETDVRKLITDRFSRGNLQVGLSVSVDESRVEAVVNQGALATVLALRDQLTGVIDPAPLRLDMLLGIRGIVEFKEAEESEEALAARDADIMVGLVAALGDLSEMRSQEGRALGQILLGHVATIEALTATVERDPSRSPQEIAAKLATQVSMLLDGAASLDRDRLHAEAALIATRADLREEIDRLKAHVVAARDLIAKGGPVGRKLDFLAQEFNRESNTICSKSNSAAVTAAGIELKVVIDQFREQVQNLE
ncbi:YicC family protein [Rhizobium rhizogenes]|uniref:YicC/YloC family endoribonuclease n=1 Tax=Rhizobium rhizogenes TaxID=359 RepID=UPI001573CB30|nr:YicC/YloC family endoribonuclease [Rhizobium rhizogenes]NTI21687.1 YicC family protein [Rhizobium rhizogenes]NTI61081.1 YicC family protein [Rhizobium rhizogenes]NTI74033.1 YicC family protein [Rhizobium rhizogenes]QTG05293.1 YicC family protein [Rhizobium rhizogenes]